MLQPANEIEVHFRHSHWSDRRAHLARMIADCPMATKRMERWNSCGADAQLWWDREGKRIIVSCMHCHDRFCWPCATARSRQIARNLHLHLQTIPTRFMTLTLRSTKSSLTSQIDRLYKSFRALRADPWWNQHVTGSATFMEITLHPTTLEWHPHLHPVVSGKFVPQEVLSRKWLGVTGDSPICHIKAVPSASVIANYVCKYASKPMDASVFVDDDRLRELIVSSAGRRLCLTTGGWTRLKLTAKPPALDLSTLTALGRLSTLTNEARDGNPRAQSILGQVRKGCSWEDVTPEEDEDAYLDRHGLL